MKKQVYKKDFFKIINYYRENKKQMIKNLLFFALFFFVSIFFVGTKIFYPFHFFIAIIFLLISIWFIFKSFFVSKNNIVKSDTYLITKKIIKKRKVLVFVIIIFIFLITVYTKIYPGYDNPYKGMSSMELFALVEKDLELSTVLLDNMELSADKLLNSNLLNNQNLTLDEREELNVLWGEYLLALMESEKITEVHKYFNNISYILNREMHVKSFIMTYSLYIKKYELFHKVMSRINGNEFIIKILNENSKISNNINSYSNMANLFFESNSLLKRGLGMSYLFFISKEKADENYGENYMLLKNQAEQSYKYLLNNIDQTIISAVKTTSFNIEKGLFEIWFPLQKNSASLMGRIYLSSRKNKLITTSQVQEMNKYMEPGDILVERKNWFVSNLGIPGFWTHSAFYIGSIDESDQYFSELFPYDGFASFSELVQDRYPILHDQYAQEDQDGYNYAVIEGRAPGIILQSLEKSAQVDYVGVMRPRLSKSDKLRAILRAFSNFGKPYDFNFDFETKDSLVCSEMIFDAYLPSKDKSGLHLDLKEVSGRKIFTPTDFVVKYDKEKGMEDRELDFVYFIEGSEAMGKAFVGNSDDFVESLKHPKYDWNLE